MTSPRARMGKPGYRFAEPELPGESPRAHGETPLRRRMPSTVTRVPARAWGNLTVPAVPNAAIASPRARMGKPHCE